MSQVLLKSDEFTTINALLVEDNLLDQKRFSRICDQTDLNFSVTEVSEPSTFEDALNHAQYDVIFVDLNLPGVSGLDLQPLVEAHELNNRTPLIVITGCNEASTAVEALKSGFSDYLEKDLLSPTSLQRATSNALEKAKLANAVQEAREDADNVDAVLKDFARTCAEDMRPTLLRMIRQVRFLRTVSADNGWHSEIVEVERNCLRIEEFFQDLSDLAGEDALSNYLRAEIVKMH